MRSAPERSSFRSRARRSSANARSHWFAVAGLVGVAVSLGSGHVCARLAFTHGVTVITAATVRSVCASLLLLALLALRRTSPLPLPREFRATLLLGLCVVAQTLLIQFAVTRLPVTLAILVFYTYPFLTSVATSLLGEHRLSARLVAALLAAFAGSCWCSASARSRWMRSASPRPSAPR